MKKHLIAHPPAVILTNPKYEHNVGGVLRASSCFGIKSLMWTGTRVQFDEDERERIPREERMKGYKNVEWLNTQYPFDHFTDTIVPVGVELLPSSENLITFEHPENAVYVFGPEDGCIPQVMRRFCHRFVFIPTQHCLNLSAAVNVILYDRRYKRITSGQEELLPLHETLAEPRGYPDLPTPVLDGIGWSGK